MKRTGSIKRKTRLSPVSKRHARELALYYKESKEWLADKLYCAWCGRPFGLCFPKTLHHTKGRGRYLMDKSTWAALGGPCHRRCKDEPEAARKAGFLLDRIGHK